MSWCPGDVEDCRAEEERCPCGVMTCVVHGHVDEGDTPYCPALVAATVEEPRGNVLEGVEDVDLSRWEDRHDAGG